jgi:hypothetical protein
MDTIIMDYLPVLKNKLYLYIQMLFWINGRAQDKFGGYRS